MNREVPAPDVERLVQTPFNPEVEISTEKLPPTQFSEASATLEAEPAYGSDLLEQATHLEARAKVGLVRKLIAQLETDHIQTILEFGLREIGERYRRGAPSALVSHNTRLLLKKDYSYQDRGLSQPTQYYVYLRRRKPKLDRYIGTLFYVPLGCTLDYFLDAEGRIIFNPPHNVFQLRDCTNPDLVQMVRLICLEPPAPDYTFTKQQDDTPEIHLHLEYLDPLTYQPITKQAYPFPACMYEKGQLDRYRWEVLAVTLTPEVAGVGQPAPPPRADSTVVLPAPALATPPIDGELTGELTTDGDLTPLPSGLDQVAVPTQVPQERPEPAFNRAEIVTTQPRRQVLELPTTKELTFYLPNPNESDAILKRMRLWVAWSEKAMPQSRWEVVQAGNVYTLMNARFKRRILRLSFEQASVTLENSLPVMMKWFHDLGLAVSQTQNQRQFSAAQLKLAHSLFVDMSLPQNDPGIFLKKLFGVEFSKLGTRVRIT